MAGATTETGAETADQLAEMRAEMMTVIVVGIEEDATVVEAMICFRTDVVVDDAITVIAETTAAAVLVIAAVIATTCASLNARQLVRAPRLPHESRRSPRQTSRRWCPSSSGSVG